MTRARPGLRGRRRGRRRVGRAVALVVCVAVYSVAWACSGSPAPPAPSGPPAPIASPGTYLTTETGSLPVVVSAPHGGTLAVPGVPVRQTGTTVLDTNTYQLAIALQAALVARTGQRAHLVAALVSRSYVDFNRTAAEAYEASALAPIYDAYHEALRRAVQTARAAAPAEAVLIDLHGQSTDVTVVFRGTRDGRTASLAALCGAPSALLPHMTSAGVPLIPACLSGGAEHPSYTGGHIVAAHGRLSGDGIDAVQLEYGLDFRQATVLSETAARLAGAIASHVRTPAAPR